MFATLAGDYPGSTEDDDALRTALAVQADAGLGILSDGLVHDGSGTTLAAAWRRARDVADELGIDVPVKLAVTGPWARSHAAAGGSSAAEAAAGVEAEAAGLRLALVELVESGCPVVEVHEPAASLPPAGAVGAVGAMLAAHASLIDGFPPGLHATLAVTGGEASALGGPGLASLPYQSYLFDLLDGPDGWRLIVDLPTERGVILGIGDATGRRRAGLETIAWATQYAASTRGRGLARVGISPSAGLGSMATEAARELIGILGEAARLLTGDPEALLRRMDPRAIDIRSAALGSYSPDPRARPGG